MGNHKFRLSDMIPNAWFYKLRDMSKSKNHNPSRPQKKFPASFNTTSSAKPQFSLPKQTYQYPTECIKPDRFRNPPPEHQKASDTRFPDPHRRSSRRKSTRKTVYKPSPKQVIASSCDVCSCHESENSFWLRPGEIQGPDLFDSSTESLSDLDFLRSPPSEFDSDTFEVPQSFNGVASWSSSCSCRFSSSATDIIIDMNGKISVRETDKIEGFDSASEIDLPPILTKPAKQNDGRAEEARKFRSSAKQGYSESAQASFPIKNAKKGGIRARNEGGISPKSRKSVSYATTGVKLRANSPRIASKKIQGNGRKSVSGNRRTKTEKRSFSESLAIVKASLDPQRDFRESMIEMIVENNIRASKDLEELLACYLSLNSDEYHELIIKAFQQIWFNLPGLHL